MQISVGGGTEPVWSKDGRELYYIANENGLTAVSVATDPALRVLSRTTLFAITGLETASPHTNYDVDAEGRFAMVLRPPLLRRGDGAELGERVEPEMSKHPFDPLNRVLAEPSFSKKWRLSLAPRPARLHLYQVTTVGGVDARVVTTS